MSGATWRGWSEWGGDISEENGRDIKEEEQRDTSLKLVDLWGGGWDLEEPPKALKTVKREGKGRGCFCGEF